jgi:hypothetical protein
VFHSGPPAIVLDDYRIGRMGDPPRSGSDAREGLATHLGAITQRRTSMLFVSEACVQPVADVRDRYEAATRSNVAFAGVSCRPSCR